MHLSAWMNQNVSLYGLALSQQTGWDVISGGATPNVGKQIKPGQGKL